jgi:hypothetical protein
MSFFSNSSLRTHGIAAGLLLAVFTTPVLAQSEIDLSSEDARIGYSIGVNIGQNLVSQGIIEGIDMDSFVAGMRDAAAKSCS